MGLTFQFNRYELDSYKLYEFQLWLSSSAGFATLRYSNFWNQTKNLNGKSCGRIAPRSSDLRW
jgi:hypothetical protein